MKMQSAAPRHSAYPLVEQFLSIQGEGEWSGSAAWFVRLAECDVGCPWCDTKESWDAGGYPLYTVGQLGRAAEASRAPMIVITGGEPLMHDLQPLTKRLSRIKARLHLETSGAYPLSGSFDWITLSPKRMKPPVDSIWAYADELKVVVASRKDLQWAEYQRRNCPPFTRLFLQPEWQTKGATALVVDYVQAKPEWKLSLQLHKYIQVR